MYVFVNGYVNFGRSCPENYYAVNTFFFLEVADVFAELLYEFPAGTLLYVVAVEALCVVVVECCGEGLDGLEFVAYGLNVLSL